MRDIILLSSNVLFKMITSVFVSVCECVGLCVCVFVNAITLEPFATSSWNLMAAKYGRSSDEFENGCILMRCGAHLTPMTFQSKLRQIV